ncbi:hypothetical protein RCL_jg1052.t1 [Rhizophagus clarus]|uniref:Uncharacterized protein n=1 Tax=Rhizophagus clarus TaxID=94130 RepID=A0A8H3M7J3_9GLOM|nr:hypothetical protein RCL_jg1052.t1 [Rhizophagus clarus]
MQVNNTNNLNIKKGYQKDFNKFTTLKEFKKIKNYSEENSCKNINFYSIIRAPQDMMLIHHNLKNIKLANLGLSRWAFPGSTQEIFALGRALDKILLKFMLICSDGSKSSRERF